MVLFSLSLFKHEEWRQEGYEPEAPLKEKENWVVFIKKTVCSLFKESKIGGLFVDGRRAHNQATRIH